MVKKLSKEVEQKLTTLIDAFGTHKQEQEKYKKMCDEENTEIKQLMSDNEQDSFTTDSYSAKYYVQERQSFNTDKALEIVKRAGINKCIKTIEVLDEDVLESMLYNEEIPVAIVEELATCNSIKSVPTLKVTCRKEK